MNKIYLLPGDIFCVSWPSLLGRMIRAVQKFHAVDGEASYSHSGIIIDSCGNTLESLWTFRQSNLSAYEGQQVLIGRHSYMTPHAAKIGINLLSREIGKLYPVHRLFLHLFRPLAKHLTTGNNLVCSERVTSFLYICNLQKYWKGMNPDDIADMIRHSNQYEVVFEGKFSTDIIDFPEAIRA